MFLKKSKFFKQLFNMFRRYPVTLYAIEFDKPEYKIHNCYLTRNDRTINFFIPHYYNGMITSVGVNSGDMLIADKVHLKLEMSDLYSAVITPVYDTPGYFTGTNNLNFFNEVVDEYVSDPNFEEQADVFMNLRTGQACPILMIGSDKVTIVLGDELSTGVPMTDNRKLDPFVILKRRSFVPMNVAHDDFESAELSENINTNLKLDNIASIWNDIWKATDEFDTAKVTIIDTYIGAMNVNGVGDGVKGITAFDYDMFYVDSTEFNSEVMTLKLIDRLQANSSTILRRLFTKNQCPWLFGNHSCGVMTSEFEQFGRTCPGSYEDCQKRKNVQNFGGYIGIASNDTGGYF